MKKKKPIYEYSLYHNMDDQLFYDNETKEFLLDFNANQKEMLLRGIHQGLPVQALAYPFVSVECMCICMDFMGVDQGFREYCNITRVDIWKTVMIYRTANECLMVLSAMRAGVNIFKEFKDVRKISPEVLELIYIAALDGVNICTLAKRLPYDKLKRHAEKKVNAKMRKENLMAFFDRLRNPESQDIYM